MKPPEGFFDFVTHCTLDNFLKARNYIITHPDFDGYSAEEKQITTLCDQGKFAEAGRFMSHNTLLNPRAQMYKAFAFSQAGDKNGEQAQKIWAVKILQGISLTGDGSNAKPYLVTSIADEKAFLNYIDEDFKSQRLQNLNGRQIDCITTASGKTVCFDVTDCMRSIQGRFNATSQATTATEKKWWEFWK
jgi:hypothetical protein